MTSTLPPPPPPPFPPASSVEWQRPHPLTVAVQIVLFVGQSGFPLLVAVGLGGGAFGFDTIAVVAGAVTVGAGALSWWMTTYAVTNESLEFRSGVLNRQVRSLPVDRIQQVSIAEPLLARLVGLAVVQVAEASADGDVEIRFLKLDAATALSDGLRARSAAASVDVATPGEVPPPEPPVRELHRSRAGRVAAYRLLSAVPGALLGLVVAAAAAVVVSAGVSGLAGIAVFVIAALVLLVVVVLTTAALVLNIGNFVLRRSSRALVIEAGVLNKRQVEVRPERIQTVTVTSGPLARRADMHEVSFSAATGKAVPTQQALVNLAPVATAAEAAAVIPAAIDVEPLSEDGLHPVSPVTVRRQLVRSGLAWLLVVVPGSIGLAFVHPLGAVLPSVVWWPIAVWYARARFARLGYAADAVRLVVRHGVLQHHLTEIPLDNVQSVSLRANVFQRRLGVADLTAATAGIGPAHHVVVPDMPADTARALAERLADHAAVTPWELRA